MTITIEDITLFDPVTLYITSVADFGEEVTLARGICWGESENPLYNVNYIETANEEGSILTELQYLVPDKTYYFRGYIIRGISDIIYSDNYSIYIPIGYIPSNKYKYILESTTSTETLLISPVSWDDLGVTLVRNEVYGSVLRNFTLSIKFVNKTGTGYDLIKDEYDTYGIYGNINITIYTRNADDNDWDLFYTGKLDLKPPKFIIDRDLYIETSIIDNNKLELLKAREETEFNLFDLTTLDGVTITDFATDKTVTIPDLPVILAANIKASGTASGNIGKDEQKYCYLTQTTAISNQIGDSITLDGNDLIYSNSHDEAINFVFLPVGHYAFSGTIVSGVYWETTLVTLAVECKIYNASAVLIGSHTYFTREITLPDGDSLPFSSSGDLPYYPIELELPAGGYIIFLARIHYQNDNGGYCTTSISLDFDSNDYTLLFEEDLIGIGDTTNQCLYIHEAFTRMIQLITSETNTAKLFRSEVLGKTDSEFETYSTNGEFSEDVLFSGLMLRNYPDAPLNISLKKLFESHSAIYNTCLGYDYVNDRFYLEKREEFYKDVLIKDLGEVAKFKRTPMPKAYYSKIVAGYENEGDYEDFNGAYEFNISKEYATSTPVKDELQAQSKLRADSLGIEFTRRKQYEENASLDTKFDKDIFILRTDSGVPKEPFFADGFPGANKYYNHDLSPRTNLVRWGNWLKACLYKSTQAIKYIKSAKLFNLFIYSDETTYIDENSDIQQAELGSMLIVPEIYTFDGYLTETDIQLILSEPHGFFRCYYNGIKYEGYIDQIQLKNYKQTANFSLIAKNANVIYLNFENGNRILFENGNKLIKE